MQREEHKDKMAIIHPEIKWEKLYDLNIHEHIHYNLNSDFSYTATAIGQKSCMKPGEIRLQTKLTSPHALTYSVHCSLEQKTQICAWHSSLFLTIRIQKETPLHKAQGKTVWSHKQSCLLLSVQWIKVENNSIP